MFERIAQEQQPQPVRDKYLNAYLGKEDLATISEAQDLVELLAENTAKYLPDSTVIVHWILKVDCAEAKGGAEAKKPVNYVLLEELVIDRVPEDIPIDVHLEIECEPAPVITTPIAPQPPPIAGQPLPPEGEGGGPGIPPALLLPIIIGGGPFEPPAADTASSKKRKDSKAPDPSKHRGMLEFNVYLLIVDILEDKDAALADLFGQIEDAANLEATPQARPKRTRKRADDGTQDATPDAK